jgi:hypothetical protein
LECFIGDREGCFIREALGFGHPVRAWSPVLRGQCLDALAHGGPLKALSFAAKPTDRAMTQGITPLLDQLDAQE